MKKKYDLPQKLLALLFLALIVTFASLSCEFQLASSNHEGAGAKGISDAAHSNGNQHFYFLPPLVSMPTFTGVFDDSIEPVITIREWGDSNSIVAEFTLTSGPGTELIRLNTEDEQYIANWHTNEFALDESKTYRITVSAEGYLLGYADVDVVNNGQDLKDVLTDEFIALKDGRTLPIKFRIEEGAIPIIPKLTGTITDLYGYPISGALIRIYNDYYSAYTASDGNGYYEFYGVPDGAYYMVIERDGYAPYTQIVAIG